MTDKKAISTTVHNWQPELKKYALADYNTDSFIKSAMLAIMQTPELQKCFETTDGKVSIYNALGMASVTGLSLNPQEGKAAIIAYKGKAQYQIMKNGMIELVERSGKVKFVTADTVRENDAFEIEKTSDGDKYIFKPSRKSRGDIDGFFAAIVLNDGVCHVKYMTREEVEHFKDQYSKGTTYSFDDNYGKFKKGDPNGHAWNTSFEGMGLKTVIKALLRNISISPEISAAIGLDDKEEAPEVITKDVTPNGADSEDILHQLEETYPTVESGQDSDFFSEEPA